MLYSIDYFNTHLLDIKRKMGEIEDKSEFDFLVGSLKEEIKELTDAYDSHDFVAQIDAIIDLIYFAGGFFTRVGIPPREAIEMFDAVHQCNLMKKKGKKVSRDITHNLDAVKPEGWTGPEEEIMKVLDRLRKANEDNN